MTMLDALTFFKQKYPLLRNGHTPFPWMERLFTRIVQGKPPTLVDLPTGAGKTDLAVVWLIALAYYGLHRTTCAPVPRRLIWVVNRKVLVGQIFRLAKDISATLERTTETAEIASGLRTLGSARSEGDLLTIIQLRGQVIDDRNWSLGPENPALIIGTVDQIGSRLLFQGYGLGKRDRPMQAGLLGVDAWVCVDEAHLVPAFVVTMRGLSQTINTPPTSVPTCLARVFDALPWYFTELSATPGLPQPSNDLTLALEPDDTTNNLLAMRIGAANAKRIVFEEEPCAEKEIPDRIAMAALAVADQRKRVAIYVRTPAQANAIRKAIENGLPKSSAGSHSSKRILTITGRTRGIERDALANHPVFKAMSTGSRTQPDSNFSQPTETIYLIGTSAAEVGVDTDADVIFCDFAPLGTLLQRLGRLDRLGHLSENKESPKMHVFGHPKLQQSSEEPAKNISEQLGKEPYLPSAKLIAASAWSGIGNPEALTRDATLRIIKEQPVPTAWNLHKLARATVEPTLCQPLTDAILQYWTATSRKNDPGLPVHPWLYGFNPDDGGTPLIGIIFRYEMDTLHDQSPAHDDPDEPAAIDSAGKRVSGIFASFCPTSNEAHWVPLHLVKEWLLGKIEENKQLQPPPSLIAWREDEGWTISSECCTDHLARMGALANQLVAEQVLIFPTTRCEIPAKILIELSGETQGISDVADQAWSDDTPARWKRITTIDGTSPDISGYHTQGEPLEVVISNPEPTTLKLTYLVPETRSENSLQFLPDHHQLARTYAESLVALIAPDDSLHGEFFGLLALVHDEGKDTPIWQRYACNPGSAPLAKAEKYNNPKTLSGFRHEWETQFKPATEAALGVLKSMISPDDRSFYHDLFMHLIVSHHGYLRPDLPDQPNWQCAALDPQRLEAVLRWHYLQSTLGFWRLAYLEAILKAADTLASRNPAISTAQPEEA